MFRENEKSIKNARFARQHEQVILESQKDCNLTYFAMIFDNFSRL